MHEIFLSHLQMQRGTYLGHPIQIANGFYWQTSRHLEGPEWNFAYGDWPRTDEDRESVLKTLRLTAERHQTPMAWYTLNPKSRPSFLVKPVAEETWMTRPLSDLPPPMGRVPLIYSEVQSSQDLNLWLDIYEKTFGADGDLDPGYLRAIQTGSTQAGVRCIRLLGHQNQEAVACGAVFIREGLAGLYDVAALPSKQGQGLGFDMTLALMLKAREEGARTMFLQTEQGTAVEHFYARMGFEKSGTGYLFSW